MDDLDLTDLENQLLYNDIDVESLDPALFYGQDEVRYGRYAFIHTFNQCFWPTTVQTVHIVGPLVGLCLLVRAVSVCPVPRWLVHFVSLATGCVAMHMFMSQYVGYPVVMCLVGYPLLYTPKGYKGPLMSFLCLVYILICELFIATPESWHKVRGTQMILAMKIISIAFDIDQGLISKIPNPLEYCGYALSASSIIFGPFMSYDNYLYILAGQRLTFSWLLGVIRSAILCYICLIHSVCIAPYMFAENDHKWLVAYQSAMSFRFSHYFVSYLSECTSVASGVCTEVTQNGKKDTKWQFDVARPQHVELPRSLVEVVVIHWNIPNHVFLKNYVFKKARSLGRFIAIFLTFGCSSLLHCSVLDWLHSLVRISARKCKPGCDHRHKEGQFWVIATNLAFGFLSVFHLAYLGIMFGGDAADQERAGFDMSHTLKKWTELDFASHWVALATFIIAQFIPKAQVT
ncbi:hypothetical protein QZH41_018889 [Actinostola sp. cb2023]|nr:hypothetical protein QZH41_018889 [Actinostola sp. cb2023]